MLSVPFTPPSEDKGLEPIVVAQTTDKSRRSQVDGGRKAWLTVFGGWLTLAATFGYISGFGVYQDFYTTTTTSSSSQISWIGSTQLFFMFFMGVVAGKLLDLGYFRATTIFGSFLFVFSIFMLSLAHPQKYYQVFLSQGLGMGIGAGLLYTPAVAIQAHHWRMRRALAMGIVITGSSTGGIFFPIMLNRLFHGSVGFAWGVRASGFVVLGMLVCANILMSSNPLNENVEVPKPNTKAIFTDAPYLMACLATFFILWGIFFPYFYLQLYAILHGMDPTLAFYTLAILNGSSIPGRILPNFYADYIGPFNALTPSCFACGVLLIALLGIKSTASTIVFTVLFGFFSGAFLSLCSPALASLSRSENEIGIRVGLGLCIVSFGALTGTPIDGALLGKGFAWSNAIIFSAVSVLVGSGFMLLSRQLVSRRSGKAIV
ncbi:MFS general substrate transporter [Amylostereum chailletii]|nr:MFS general substrate transporter [Amylostereum chailletii]